MWRHAPSRGDPAGQFTVLGNPFAQERVQLGGGVGMDADATMAGMPCLRHSLCGGAM